MKYIILLSFFIILATLILYCDDKVEMKLGTKEALMEKIIEAVNNSDESLLYGLYDTENFDSGIKKSLKEIIKKCISDRKESKLISKSILKIEDYENLDSNFIGDEKIIKNTDVTHIIWIKSESGELKMELIFPIYKKKNFWYITINEKL